MSVSFRFLWNCFFYLPIFFADFLYIDIDTDLSIYTHKKA